jgi:hypothetical protein
MSKRTKLNSWTDDEDAEFVNVGALRPIRSWAKTEEGTTFRGELQDVRAGKFGPLFDVAIDTDNAGVVLETWPSGARLNPGMQRCPIGGRFRVLFMGQGDAGKGRTGSYLFDIRVKNPLATPPEDPARTGDDEL